MQKRTVQPELSNKDRLAARPDCEKLRTTLEPDSPEARHEGIDPKIAPESDKGEPTAQGEEGPANLERSA